MIRILGIALIAGIKILLCKGIALGILLLLFRIKGKRLRFNSDEWDNFFISLPAAKVQKYGIAIYLTAAMISSAISYLILELAAYRHSLGIAVLIFLSGLVITAYKYAKEKDHLFKKYQELPEKILEERERKNSNNE